MGDTSGFLSLDTVLRYHDASRQQLATKLLYDAAQALSAMHAAGIVHGDLRCEHILVSPDLQTVQLSGLAYSFDSHALRHHFMASGKTAAEAGVSISSAVRWLAPECVAGGIPTPASDIYAFGLSLYEALTEQMPFDGRVDAQIVELKKMKGTQLPDARPDKIGREAWSLIQDACHHNPIFRPSIQIVVMTLRNIHTTAPMSSEATIATATPSRVVVASMSVSQLPMGTSLPVMTPHYHYPIAQPTVTKYQYVTGQPIYYYPPAMTAPARAWQPPEYNGAGTVLPAATTNFPPSYAAPPPPQLERPPVPMWKRTARFVAVLVLVAGVAIPTSLLTGSSTADSDYDSSTSTPTPSRTSKPTSTTPPTQAPMPATSKPLTTSPPTDPPTKDPSGVQSVSTILDAIDLRHVSAITVGDDGTIYCSDISDIYSVHGDGSQFQRIAGSGYGYQNGEATADARFGRAEGLVVDKQGNLVVADSDNHRLRIVKLHASPPTAADVAGDGTEADRDGTLSDSSFASLNGIALDRSTNTLYISTIYSSIIRKVSLDGDAVSTLGVTMFLPSVVAVSPATGDVYVLAGGKHITKISNDGLATTVVAGSEINGFADAVGEDARFQYVTGMAFSPSGKDLYIADRDNNCIRNLNIATSTVSTLVGACGYGPEHQDGDRSSARFAKPSSIAVGPDGTIFLADLGDPNPRLRRITMG